MHVLQCVFHILVRKIVGTRQKEDKAGEDGL